MKAHPNPENAAASFGKTALITVVLLLALPVHVWSDSCDECHLHRSFVRGSASDTDAPETLAGFHIKEFKGEGLTAGCRRCHENLQESNKLPHSEVCLRCHTRGKTAKGDPRMAFHSGKNHWPLGKVSCTDCHKGHIKGNPDIKFLTTSAVNVCSRCHEKGFNIKENIQQQAD